MEFVQSIYNGSVPDSFVFVPNQNDVLPCQTGSVEQDDKVSIKYMVFEDLNLLLRGVTVSKERCVELLRPVLGDVDLHLSHSVYQTDFPIHVTLPKLIESELGFMVNGTSGHAVFQDLKVKVLFGENNVTMMAKFHPEMEQEEQVTEAYERLLATFA